MNAKRKTHDDNANLICVIEIMKRSSSQSGRKIDILTAAQKVHPQKKMGVGIKEEDDEEEVVMPHCSLMAASKINKHCDSNKISKQAESSEMEGG